VAVKLLLVDDHPLFLEGLSNLIALSDRFEVVGVASNGVEAVAQAARLKPDMIIMDAGMPVMGGLEATRAIKHARPETRILILTASEDEKDFFEAVKAGAQGYILKSQATVEILDLLMEAAGGGAAFTAKMASKTLLALSEQGHAQADRLTRREHEVLEHVAQGQTNRAIAEALGLSEVTVRFHLRNILSKLHVQNRVEAAVYAVKERLI
jgi:two-component system NarL family response regulator